MALEINNITNLSIAYIKGVNHLLFNIIMSTDNYIFKHAIIKNIHNYCVKNCIIQDNKHYTNFFKILNKTLYALDKKISGGEINLIDDISVSDNTLSQAHNTLQTKVGILAFTANPIHRGHIISSLMLINELGLHCVICLIQGDMDYKNLTNDQKLPKNIRHDIAKKVLNSFYPLLRYSDFGYNNNLIGESNCFKLFEMNPKQNFKLYYFSGSESIKRVKNIITNLEKIIKNHKFNTDSSIEIALLPLGNFKNISDKFIKKSNISITIVLKDYKLELHSTQFREGDFSIVPQEVINILKYIQ